MTTTQLGPLTVRRFRKGLEPQDKPRLLVVLLHGFGAPGDDLAGLAPAIDVPPGTELIFPEAVHELAKLTGQRMYGDARAWWMIDMVRLQLAMATGRPRDMANDVPEGLAEARAAVTAMLDALAPDVPLILGGFSQGAMLSLDVALREPARKLAGLALLSGTVIAEPEWRPLFAARAGLPVFQSHGLRDAILPYPEAERLGRMLADSDLDVQFQGFDGEHTIPLEVVRRLSAWIRARG